MSAIINSVKKTIAKIKDMAKSIPAMLSFPLYESMDKISGTNRSDINPNAAPIPCILEAVVSTSLLSFTLKIPDSIPAPTANIKIKTATDNARVAKLPNI